MSYSHGLEWRKLVQQQEASAEESIFSSNNVGTFYKIVNKRLSNRNKILTITDKHGDVLTNDRDIANAFNDYFASVSVCSNNHSPQVPSYSPVSLLTSIDISELDILAAIGKLKSNLSAGPDGLPQVLFKRVIALPLTLAFR